MQFLQKKICKYWFFTHSCVMPHKAPPSPWSTTSKRLERCPDTSRSSVSSWSRVASPLPSSCCAKCPRLGIASPSCQAALARKNPALINNKKPNGAKAPPAKPTNGERPEEHRWVIAKEQCAHFISLSPAQIRQQLREKTGRQNDSAHI